MKGGKQYYGSTEEGEPNCEWGIQEHFTEQINGELI